MIRTTSSRLANQGLNALRVVTTTCRNSVSDKRYLSTLPRENLVDPDKQMYHHPLEGYWKSSSLEPHSYKNLTLDKYVWTNLKRWENKICAVDVVTGRSYTYAKVRDCSAALAIRLQSKFKLNPRDVLAICLPNCPEYPIAAMGAIEAGLTVTTVNPIYTADEIGRQILVSNARLLIGTVHNYQTLKDASVIAKRNIPIVVVRQTNDEVLPDGAIDFLEIINTTGVDFSLLKETNIKASDNVFLPFSSGTTGLPKCVMLSHNNITVNCEQIQSKMPDEEYLIDTTETYQEVVPCILPFFHIYGLTVIMLSKLFLGMKLVTIPQFRPDDLAKALGHYKATAMNLVPPLVLFMADSNIVTAKTAATLRIAVSGAAPIGQTDVDKFLAKFPNVNFAQGYGMTESSSAILMTPKGCKKYSTVGFLIGSTEAKVLALGNKDGLGVGPNIPGELLVRGPQIMKGYLNNDEANNEIFRESLAGGERWMCTGDIGYYDEEGLFYITDRMKELIKVKGFQVPPAELEECLRSHPKISDAAVIGIPHDQHGEVPRAIVVLKPNVKASEEEIKQFVAEKVVFYKKLEGGVVFVDEIPKNPTGKIVRKDLKAKYA